MESLDVFCDAGLVSEVRKLAFVKTAGIIYHTFYNRSLHRRRRSS